MTVALVPLSQVAKLLSGGTPSKANLDLWTGNVPWLTPKDMSRWSGRTEETVSESAVGRGTKLAPANASFVAVRGMSLHNEIRIIHSERPLTFNQDVKAVVAKEGFDPVFLYYALMAQKPQLLEWVSSSSHGTGVLDTDRLNSLLVPDIALNDQAVVVNVFRSLDDKIELNRRMNETLEGIAQAIFRDWFIDFGPVRRKQAGATDPVEIMGALTHDLALAAELAALFSDGLDNEGLPVGWTMRPLDEIAEFLNGLALQKFPATDGDGDPGLPVIKIAELRGGLTEKTDRASQKIPARYIVHNSDYIFSWFGSLMAKVWTEGDGALNQHLFKVTSAEFPQWFYAAWVRFHLPEFQQIAAAKATTMGHIQRGHLSAAMTVCPPRATIEIMSNVLHPLWDKAIQADLENRALAETRDYLLPRLMSGDIQVGAALQFRASNE